MSLAKFFCAAVLGAVLALTSIGPARAAANLWTELPNDGSLKKADTLPDFVALAARLGPAVVNVSSVESAQATDVPESESPEGKDPQGGGGGQLGPFGFFGPHESRSLGSGFIINSAGYILTNDHVVEDSKKVLVTLKDGEQYTARLVGQDEKSDLALIKIKAPHPLPVAPLGDSARLRVGQWVMAIGDPFGFDHSVTVGVVSAIGRFIPGNYDDFVQTDASINPGNSGGPLIDADGAVIGINSAIYTRTGSYMGIGFAIPINIVKAEIGQLDKTGHVTRGWLGVLIQKMTPDLAKSMGIAQARGALVSEVIKDSPAMKAGIKRGDVIVNYDGATVSDSQQLPLMVGSTALGSRVKVTVLRNNHPLTLPVTITVSHERQFALATRPAPRNKGVESSYGLYLKDLTPQLAHELGLSDQHGVVVSEVLPNSPADQAGLRARDLVLEVNRQPVTDVASFKRALKAGTHHNIVLMLVKRANETMFLPLKPRG